MVQAAGVRLLVVATVVGIHAQSADVEIVADRLKFPEGPLLVNGMIHWVEYAGNKLMQLKGGKKVALHSGEGCGHNGLQDIPDKKQLVLMCTDSSEVLFLDYSGKVLERYKHDDQGRPFTDGINDAVVAADGGVYVTGSGPWKDNPPIEGTVYYRAPGADAFTEVASRLGFPNGLVVAKGGKELVVSEMNTNRLLKFKIHGDGSLGNAYVFKRFSQLFSEDCAEHSEWLGADGMKTDSKGNIYAAHNMGGRVVKLSPKGELLKTYDVPTKALSNVEIDETNGYLYVTAIKHFNTAPYWGELLRIPLNSSAAATKTSKATRLYQDYFPPSAPTSASLSSAFVAAALGACTFILVSAVVCIHFRCPALERGLPLTGGCE